MNVKRRTLKPKTIHLIAGARPNFMKIAPLYHALKKEDWAVSIIVHTGQHYDINMSDAFFQDLSLPEPNIHLNVGSGTHAEQTAKVMMAYEKVLMADRPDLVVVVGDVNSTMATTIAAVKLGTPVGHLEAGLRSFDRTMPEEINRIVTDALADILWTPSPDADENLLKEGIPEERIVRVGNIMIDSFEMLRHKIETEITYSQFGLTKGNYCIVTLHRPSNVDNPCILEQICYAIQNIVEEIPLVFPVHPRTRNNLKAFGLIKNLESAKNLILMEPLSYIPFMSLVLHSRFVLTDSGGIQEETTYLGIPCLTLRPNTERPITISQGTNRLCKIEDIVQNVKDILNEKNTDRQIPELWDGNSAKRVKDSIKQFLRIDNF